MKTALRTLVFAFAVILLSSVAYAEPQTAPAPSPAPAAAAPATSSGTASSTTPRRNGPCKTDVQNFCGSVQKGGDRILTCLKQHVGQLSPSCEAAMKRHAEKDAAKTNPPSAVVPAASTVAPAAPASPPTSAPPAGK